MIPDGWQYCQLQDLATVERGKFSARPRNDPKYYGGDIPFVQTGDVARSNGKLTEFSQTLNELGLTVSKLFPSGTILVTIAANIGETSICQFPVACPDSLVGIEANENISEIWLCHALEMKKDYLEQRATQNAQKNINLEILRPLEIGTPPDYEQKAIATILSTWDRAIEKTEALIEAKERRKAGLMQRLLTGKVRFGEFVKSQARRKTKSYDLPEDWGYPTIGDIAVAVSKKNGTKTSLPVLSCTKHSGLVDSLAYFGKQVFSKDLSTYKVVPRGAFAYATNHIEEGSIGYQDLHDKALISPMYTVFNTSGAVHDGFLFKLLKTEWYRHIFQTRTSASVDRRGSLRWKEFAKIHIPLPSMEEQGKIAEVLDKAEQEIEEHRNQLAALKEQKKGLMQQLLTGKMRVKIRN
jgi:type I restriction enzyme S subunit